MTLAFAFSAVCALALNAQEEGKKQETKREAKQTGGVKAGKTARWQVGDPTGTIEKVDAEKKTITIRDEDGPVHTLTIDQHVTVTNFQGEPVAGFDEKQLSAGAFAAWKTDNKGNIVHLFVGTQPGFGGRAPGTAGKLKKIESREGKSKDKDKTKEEKKGDNAPQR
jgi:hypothetical protein